MTVCITEKPSVARDIANILGAHERRDGYYEGGGYQVTWTLGHLCTLKEPHDYWEGWKPWAMSALPMIPARFGIKLIADKGVERQFAVIEALVRTADRVVNCGDAGQEGELIQRWVMQKAGVACPVQRLWISSLTDQAIREGFRDLKPSADYDRLYHAGLSRAIGDWLLGMNCTRLYTLKYSRPRQVLSVGRVQTPTLALIVKRQAEIDNFKPEDYWELHTTYRNADFTAQLKTKLTTPEKAKEALDKVQGKPLTVKEVQKKQGREAPPRLFDLTSLQVECNKRWGWTADRSLRLIQSLYEKKVTTYPRVDTTFLTDDLYPKIAGIMERMTPYAPLCAPLLAQKLPKPKRIFDNSKVTDHHAIIPTGESPTVLAGDERQMYHLIARRFIAAFYPDCRYDATTVNAEAGGTAFRVNGKVITDPGWRRVFQDGHAKAKDDEKKDDKILPPFTPGESGPHSPSLVKKTTTPPKPYTEGTLLRAMETAGKTVDDDDLRDAMKENGIGRPSTRAAIIETLFRRNYLARRGKSIYPTDAGKELIATIQEELLKSAKLTGLWENKLRRIERGEYSPAEFIGELKAMVTKIVDDVIRDDTQRKIGAEKRE